MKKRKPVWLALVIAAVVGGIVFWPLYRPLVRIEFTEGETAHIDPARGFYYPVKSTHPERMQKVRSAGCSLVFIMYDIGAFANGDISDGKLAELKTALQAARDSGLKVIFRAAYGFEGDLAYGDPKDIARVTGHIEQIKPILEEYSDILYVVQAGFLGAYGEWHSSNFGDPPSMDAQAAVLGALLNGLPDNVFVCVRRPSFIRELFVQGKLPPEYSGRIGVHNDALLGSEDDLGTYTDWSREEELAWAADYFEKRPYGGETCCRSAYSGAENAVLEFGRLHLAYLNSQYNKDVLDSWKDVQIEGEDAYTYIARHMGYRFFLESADVKAVMKPGGKGEAVLQVHNSGWASLGGNYKANLVLKGYNTRIVIPMDADMSGLLPGGSIRMKAVFELPEDIRDETLIMGLEISDAGSSVSDDERYAVSLHNAGVDFMDKTSFFAEYERIKDRYELVGRGERA